MRTLAAYIRDLPFFDSHSHLAGFDFGGPVDDRAGRSLADLLANDYLAYVSGSCCDTPVTPTCGVSEADPRRDEASFHALIPLLDACRAMSTWAALRMGLRALHGLRGTDLTERNWKPVNTSIRAAYGRGERAWQRQVVRRAGVFRQVQICQLPYTAEHLAALPVRERQAQLDLLLPALVLDGFCFTGLTQNRQARERALALLGARPRHYADYVAFCGRALDLFVKGGGRAVKWLAAYVRTLAWEPVPDAEARRLYARGPDRLPPHLLRRLQDHLLRTLLGLAHLRHLPLLVHTGYALPVEHGDVTGLQRLVGEPGLRGLKVALCHAGWPRYGTALVLARTFRNVYLDLAWVPLLSPTAAEAVLGEAIDMVPMNKILLGTDCGCVESFYGTVLLTRRLVTRVLARKVVGKQFDDAVARRFAQCVFHANACEFFNEPQSVSQGTVVSRTAREAASPPSEAEPVA